MRPPALTHDSAAVFLGDCIEVLAEMPDNSIDAIVTDPPYGLGFMGKAWDDLPPGLDWAVECLRVLKPGGHLLAFGGTRTWHRLAVAVEDAGFEVRDSIAWLYGSGFPKSLDVAKAIDKAAGATREVVGTRVRLGDTRPYGNDGTRTYSGYAANDAGDPLTAPATPAAQQWQGWGTALKPAFEPIVVARKPLIGTVAANVLAHGTGALNVDGCRVEGQVPLSKFGSRHIGTASGIYGKQEPKGEPEPHPAGRWPANVVLDGDAAAELDEQSGILSSQKTRTEPTKGTDATESHLGTMNVMRSKEYLGETGGASRFFPVFREEPQKEGGHCQTAGAIVPVRPGEPCESCGGEHAGTYTWEGFPAFRYQAKAPTRERPVVTHEDGTKTAHPTVKPKALMAWLCRLVVPAGGTVLDTFAGSGATLEAAVEEGFYALGIEREETYLPLIQIRLDRATVPAPDTDEEGAA